MRYTELVTSMCDPLSPSRRLSRIRMQPAQTWNETSQKEAPQDIPRDVHLWNGAKRAKNKPKCCAEKKKTSLTVRPQKWREIPSANQRNLKSWKNTMQRWQLLKQEQAPKESLLVQTCSYKLRTIFAACRQHSCTTMTVFKCTVASTAKECPKTTWTVTPPPHFFFSMALANSKQTSIRLISRHMSVLRPWL